MYNTTTLEDNNGKRIILQNSSPTRTANNSNFFALNYDNIQS